MLSVVLVTYPEKEKANDFCRSLVSEHLVACINILPGIKSLYWWEGKVEEGNEVLLIMKTTVEKLPILEARVKELHPYSVPEFVVIPASYVGDEYMNWAAEVLR